MSEVAMLLRIVGKTSRYVRKDGTLGSKGGVSSYIVEPVGRLEGEYGGELQDLAASGDEHAADRRSARLILRTVASSRRAMGNSYPERANTKPKRSNRNHRKVDARNS